MIKVKIYKVRGQQSKIKMSDKIIKKNQFQIRKVPIKPYAPQKLPQLYALDIHSICPPKKQKKNIQWASINYNPQKHYTYELNDRIISSPAYQQLYQKYLKLKQERQGQKQLLQEQIDCIDSKIEHSKEQKLRLINVRDQFYNQVQTLRDELVECRNKSQNVRWEIYHQRGTYYVNVNNYSFLDNSDPTYEDYLLLEEQIGNVPRGLNEIQLALLPKTKYNPANNNGAKLDSDNDPSPNPENEDSTYTKQICCICYDQINQDEYITILKCKHFHHCDCIKDWLVKQKNCPICKKEVIVDQFHMKKETTKDQDHKKL